MSKQTVAIAGLGAIGAAVAKALLAGAIPEMTLVAASARDVDKARATLGAAGAAIPLVAPGDLAALADIVVEAMPAAAFDDVAWPTIEQGKTLMALSVGCLLDRQSLIDRAKETGATIIAPTGAILGLDAIRAAAEGEIESALVETRKPPKGLVGAPYLIENNINVEGITEPLCIFEGAVRDAVKAFPANVNVSAAVSLAGIGPDKTRIKLWADPGVTRNTHTVTVVADSTRFTMTIEGVPSPDNPRTGMLTPNSALAALRRLGATLVIGT